MHTETTPPETTETTPASERRHFYSTTLPWGSVANDRYGKAFVVWPDGSYGYSQATRCSPNLSSYTFGPYTLQRWGLTEAECDAAAEAAAT